MRAAFRAQKKFVGWLTISKLEPGADYQGVLVLGEYILVQVGVQLISPALADLRVGSSNQCTVEGGDEDKEQKTSPTQPLFQATDQGLDECMERAWYKKIQGQRLEGEARTCLPVLPFMKEAM
jgi:hypothetical protein